MRKAKQMRIKLENTGKRYNREWIFRHLDFEFQPNGRYAITGPNGSGKSTLLQVIAGSTLHSEGKLFYTMNGGEVKEPFRHVSIAAPYLEMVEELTATESLKFHAGFKPFITEIPVILEETGLSKAANKQLRYFSSGMKQRLKLGQAFFTNSPVLLLDEPTTNLDAEGIALYMKLVEKYAAGKMVIVSSNDPQEYSFCNEVIRITDHRS